MALMQAVDEYTVYLKASCAVEVYFGQRNFGVDEKPAVRLMPTNTGESFTFDDKSNALSFPLNVEVVSAPGREREAFDLMELVVKKSITFQEHKGHVISKEWTPEYKDGDFVVAVVLILKAIIQDT